FILLLRYAPGMETDIKTDVSEETFTFLKTIAENKNSNVSADTLRALLLAYTEAGKTAIPELPLELALVKLVG
ncbi:MAG: hypothetical protein AAB944_02090, partial [Patescibacteria group bacterium]